MFMFYALGTGVKGVHMCRDFKTIIKPTKSQSAFYYHHVSTILNIASDKILLLEKVFCWSNFETTAVVAVEF